MKNIIITIDGPAASGKEKISEYICTKWKLKHLDSGVLYRRLAYIFFSNDVDTENIRDIEKKIKEIKLIFKIGLDLRMKQLTKGVLLKII